MSQLRVALVVPVVQGVGRASGRYNERELARWIAAGEVELVVFPEMFRDVEATGATLASHRRAAVAVAEQLAGELGVATLVGVWVTSSVDGRGMQCSAYFNPRPKAGETRSHFYAKHATSVALPYESADYAQEREALFTPIALRGRRIGVQLCHDQFFGLVSAKLDANGADVLIDLTGSNVIASKWRNVITGRTLEREAPFFCTMSRENKESSKNVAFAIGMRGGREIEPLKESTTAKQGDLLLYAVDGPLRAGHITQARTAKHYEDLSLALAPSVARADLRVDGHGAHGELTVVRRSRWKELRLGEQSVGVLSLPEAELADPLCIYRHDLRPTPFAAHVVCFTSVKPGLPAEHALALARLRAIEHRVAVVVWTPEVHEVIRASRYKNIQRFTPNAQGVYGLKLELLGGTSASLGATPQSPVPPQWHAHYLGLLGPTSALPRVEPRGGDLGDEERAPGGLAYELGHALGSKVRRILGRA